MPGLNCASAHNAAVQNNIIELVYLLMGYEYVYVRAVRSRPWGSNASVKSGSARSLAVCMLFTLFKGHERTKANRKIDKNSKTRTPKNPLPSHVGVSRPPPRHDAQITCPS